MRRLILFSVIQQLLHHISRVESLSGPNVTLIRGGELPFIASFQTFPEEHNFCGGALITNKHVITSAYCLRNSSRENFRIVFEVAHAQDPALAYTAASWITYIDWTQGQGIPYDSSNGLGMAIVTLTDKVYHVNPVPLNGFTKRQLDGKRAKMIGWRNDNVLSKVSVKILSDADCQRNVDVLRNNVAVLNVRRLCSAGIPYALLGNSDSGAPLLLARDNSLLGIAFGICPPDGIIDGNFSTDFIRQHQVNLHYSIEYYRLFIHSVIPAIPGA